jgi:hypothetical protein
VDVPAEDLPADLILRGSGEDGGTGDAHKRRNGVNEGETEKRNAFAKSKLLARPLKAGVLPRYARREQLQIRVGKGILFSVRSPFSPFLRL